MIHVPNSTCRIPGCNRKTAAVANNNARLSKMYCEDHRSGINVRCSVCGKEQRARASDYMKVIESGRNVVCRKCSVTSLNKSEAMRAQARDLGIKLSREKRGIFSDEIREKAIERARSIEAATKREETKRKNGFYSPGGGYYRGLKKRKENGALDRFIKSGHTPEARALQNRTRWNNMSEEEKESRIRSLVNSHTEESRALIIRNRVKNGWKPNTEAARLRLAELRKDADWRRKHSFFDREGFYSEKFDLISFNTLGKVVTLNDIDRLTGVPGVWSKETNNGTVLDVSETQDIGKEMLFSLRAFDANKEKEDSELKQNKLSLRKKYRDMHKHADGKIIFKLIAIGIEDREVRQAIEAQYAHDTRAFFWSPAPGQQIANNKSPLQI